MARHLVGAAIGEPELFIAVGDGTSAAATSDTQLESERQRAPVDLPQVRDNHVATVSAELVASGTEGDPTVPLTEAGILIKLPNEDEILYNRVTFDVVSKSPSMSLTLTWEVTF